MSNKATHKVQNFASIAKISAAILSLIGLAFSVGYDAGKR